MDAGHLDIQVPAGAVGGEYWIYVDGQIASVPPHGTADPQIPGIVVAARLRQDPSGTILGSDGWAIATSDGPVLGTTHEKWDDSLAGYLDTAPKDRLHIFQQTDIAVSPGSHTVEVVFVTQATHAAWNPTPPSFPFAITRKYPVDVAAGQTADIYVAIPDRWSNATDVPAARAFCPPSPQPPDAEDLRAKFAAYTEDPMVIVLRKASFAVRAPGDHTAMLDLPPELGGPRAFDAVQIGEIIDAMVASHALPSQDEVADCAKRYPIFASSFDAYRQTLALFASDMESFRKFRDNLVQPQ